MISVLLVDDEYLALEDLKAMIDWDSMGFKIIGTATSGKQALRMIKQEPADLVITDISMPNMSGIELIEQIKNKFPNTLFLLLTAYKEIPYMKSALALGVEDYLCKDEITPELLHRRLSTIYRKLYTTFTLKQSFLQKNLQIYFNSPDSDIPSDLSVFTPGNYVYCVISSNFIFPQLSAFFEQGANADTSYFLSLLRCCELFSFPADERLLPFCSFYSYHNEIILLIKIHQLPSEYILSQLLHEFCHALHKNILSNSGKHISILYQSMPMTLAQLREDYFAHSEQIKSRMFLPQDSILKIDCDKLYLNHEKPEISETELRRLFQTTPEQVANSISSSFHHIIMRHNASGFLELMESCVHLIEKYSQCRNTRNSFESLNDIFFLSQWLIDEINHICIQKKSIYSKETQQAVEYIHDNYSNVNLSIQEISSFVSLSPTHLSRIFKQDTGITVWDYLSKYRVEKACDILSKSNAKIYEIAEMVGYSSAQYFSQVFYKYKNIKPLDYKRQNS